MGRRAQVGHGGVLRVLARTSFLPPQPGLDLASSSICEIALLEAESRAVFSTVVRPPVLPLDAGVHGIDPSELAEGPLFSAAFRRMVLFLDELCERAVTDDSRSDSSAELCPDELPHLRPEPPGVVLAAHNGLRFDFPMFVSECWRAGVPLVELARWGYLDTLDVLRGAGAHVAGACLKLQCQRTARNLQPTVRAHRALDDAIVLADVVDVVARRLGSRVPELLPLFAVGFDAGATALQVSALVG